MGARLNRRERAGKRRGAEPETVQDFLSNAVKIG